MVIKTLAQRPDMIPWMAIGFTELGRRRWQMIADEEISKTAMHMVVPKDEWERAERICQIVAAEMRRAYEESTEPWPEPASTPLRLAYQWLTRGYIETGVLPKVDGC
jgi:hypothetical protein